LLILFPPLSHHLQVPHPIVLIQNATLPLTLRERFRCPHPRPPLPEFCPTPPARLFLQELPLLRIYFPIIKLPGHRNVRITFRRCSPKRKPTHHQPLLARRPNPPNCPIVHRSQKVVLFQADTIPSSKTRNSKGTTMVVGTRTYPIGLATPHRRHPRSCGIAPRYRRNTQTSNLPQAWI
jgi:hypothetical protein